MNLLRMVIAVTIIGACVSVTTGYAASACCDPGNVAAIAGAILSSPRVNTAVFTGPHQVPGPGTALMGGVPASPGCGGCQARARSQSCPMAGQSCCSRPNAYQGSMQPGPRQMSTPALPSCCVGKGATVPAQRSEAGTPISRFTSSSTNPAQALPPTTRASYNVGVQISGAGPYGRPGYFPGSNLW